MSERLTDKRIQQILTGDLTREVANALTELLALRAELEKARGEIGEQSKEVTNAQWALRRAEERAEATLAERDSAEAMRGWSDQACRAVVEGMRAKCEAIARDDGGRFPCGHTLAPLAATRIAHAIAALKGKGGGK